MTNMAMTGISPKSGWMVPKEADPIYIYLIEEESENGMRNSITKVLNLPREELIEKGKKARDFVLKYKNNNIQAKRIIRLAAKL